MHRRVLVVIGISIVVLVTVVLAVFLRKSSAKEAKALELPRPDPIDSPKETGHDTPFAEAHVKDVGFDQELYSSEREERIWTSTSGRLLYVDGIYTWVAGLDGALQVLLHGQVWQTLSFKMFTDEPVQFVTRGFVATETHLFSIQQDSEVFTVRALELSDAGGPIRGLHTTERNETHVWKASRVWKMVNNHPDMQTRKIRAGPLNILTMIDDDCIIANGKTLSRQTEDGTEMWTMAVSGFPTLAVSSGQTLWLVEQGMISLSLSALNVKTGLVQFREPKVSLGEIDRSLSQSVKPGVTHLFAISSDEVMLWFADGTVETMSRT